MRQGADRAGKQIIGVTRAYAIRVNRKCLPQVPLGPTASRDSLIGQLQVFATGHCERAENEACLRVGRGQSDTYTMLRNLAIPSNAR